ncbi:nuclear pore complex protein NUP50A-like [Senna tora]|uniref:Nuclear pore complex protein NUP50A-like n=1 Tax=Senna tora TaxID=362788 RepID=A0A834W9L6_9FABA|nr:nuclear pore complex protein NUP50A-like [Senna tora]
MGDAENALPPSKKRAAGRELSRDTPLDDEEDTPELETGTFKRASDEVLASRRIVKVRRQQTNSAPSTNPFAGIRLTAPTESNAIPGEATAKAQSAGENTDADTKGSDGITNDSEEAKDGDNKESESKTDEASDKPAANKDAPEENSVDKEHTEESVGEKTEADNEQSKDANESENQDKDTADKTGDDNDTINDDEKDTENEGKKDDKGESAEGSPLKSFQQLSSSQNAFTGLAGTGFSASSFSFGSLSKDGPASGSGSGSIFGLGLSNNGNAVFGATGVSAASKGEGSGFSTMQEVVVETGEENEKVVFNAESVLFEFADGSWKERGKGEVKVNVTTKGTEKARLLMRSRGNYRLILNARLYPDMKLTNMEKKGVTFACINSATEGKDGLSTFALKFKDGSIVEEFKATVMTHKGEKTSVLKTPENSPKASDD